MKYENCVVCGIVLRDDRTGVRSTALHAHWGWERDIHGITYAGAICLGCLQDALLDARGNPYLVTAFYDWRRAHWGEYGIGPASTNAGLSFLELAGVDAPKIEALKHELDALAARYEAAFSTEWRPGATAPTEWARTVSPEMVARADRLKEQARDRQAASDDDPVAAAAYWIIEETAELLKADSAEAVADAILDLVGIAACAASLIANVDPTKPQRWLDEMKERGRFYEDGSPKPHQLLTYTWALGALSNSRSTEPVTGRPAYIREKRAAAAGGGAAPTSTTTNAPDGAQEQK